MSVTVPVRPSAMKYANEGFSRWDVSASDTVSTAVSTARDGPRLVHFGG